MEAHGDHAGPSTRRSCWAKHMEIMLRQAHGDHAGQSTWRSCRAKDVEIRLGRPKRARAGGQALSVVLWPDAGPIRLHMPPLHPRMLPIKYFPNHMPSSHQVTPGEHPSTKSPRPWSTKSTRWTVSWAGIHTHTQTFPPHQSGIS